MSEQTITFEWQPLRRFIKDVLITWGSRAYGYAYFDCSSSPVSMNVTPYSEDGTQLQTTSVFTAPCTGKLTRIQVIFEEPNGYFKGTTDISDFGITVLEGKEYTIYIAETISLLSTATVKSL